MADSKVKLAIQTAIANFQADHLRQAALTPRKVSKSDLQINCA